MDPQSAVDLRKREQAVGRYALDLLLSDAEGRVVIVENQLEQTDHTHLGQLLTYCAGAAADAVIWIASSITEEHEAALKWLNENTIAGVGFSHGLPQQVEIGGKPRREIRCLIWPYGPKRHRLQASQIPHRRHYPPALGRTWSVIIRPLSAAGLAYALPTHGRDPDLAPLTSADNRRQHGAHISEWQSTRQTGSLASAIAQRPSL